MIHVTALKARFIADAGRDCDGDGLISGRREKATLHLTGPAAAGSCRLHSTQNGNFIPRLFARKAHWSVASSMILLVGLPAPWPARVSILIKIGAGPA